MNIRLGVDKYQHIFDHDTINSKSRSTLSSKRPILRNRLFIELLDTILLYLSVLRKM